MTSLAERLRITGVNEDEVAALLNEHFGFAAERSPGTVEYGRQGEPAAIVLLYSKKDRLKELRAGPGLRESDIETLASRIEAELRASSGKSVTREIVFCSVPVIGYYRTRDVHILPAPPECPRPPVLMAQHPFILEFPVAASTNPWI